MMDLTPLTTGEVKRVEIRIEDHSIITMPRQELSAYLATIEDVINRASQFGLVCYRYRDHARMCDVIVITLPTSAI